MTRRKTIGFDRKIELEWLDATAGRVAAGATDQEVREYLVRVLEGSVAGESSGSARGKTITVLRHIWSKVPKEAGGLKTRCLELLSTVSSKDRLALHWAMTLGTYPFVADVATTLGRLLALQGTCSLAQIRRRLVESWGDRSTMIRAAQRAVRTMVAWGVIEETKTRGVYERHAAPRPVAENVALVLLEAILMNVDKGSVPLRQLTDHPALFPFDLAVPVQDLRKSKLFTVHREGVDADMVELASEAPPPGPKQLRLC